MNPRILPCLILTSLLLTFSCDEEGNGTNGMAETEEAVVATTPAPTERLPLAQPQKKTRKTALLRRRLPHGG